MGKYVKRRENPLNTCDNVLESKSKAETANLLRPPPEHIHDNMYQEKTPYHRSPETTSYWNQPRRVAKMMMLYGNTNTPYLPYLTSNKIDNAYTC